MIGQQAKQCIHETAMSQAHFSDTPHPDFSKVNTFQDDIVHVPETAFSLTSMSIFRAHFETGSGHNRLTLKEGLNSSH